MKPAGILGPFLALSSNRSLTLEFARRDILGRYRGANFGLFWSLISPFLLLCIYAFAFGSVMGGRWPQVGSGQASFAIVIFSGLIVHGFFAECLTRSPLLITSNPTFVKRVVFPLDMLPWSMVLSALFHTMTNVLIFIVLRLALDGAFAWTTILLPVILVPLVALTLGVSWFLASLGVYIRDISQVTGVVSTALLFLSSAMIPLDSVPERYRWILLANPLTFIIDQAREVMLWERMPDWSGLAVYMVVALVVMITGHAWFRATQRGFADVL
ncbi:MAG: ABC transporter permease [Pseudomonadota bacterium]